MTSDLGSIEDIGDQKLKIEQYKEKLADIFQRQDEHEIKAFVDHSKHAKNGTATINKQKITNKNCSYASLSV